MSDLYHIFTSDTTTTCLEMVRSFHNQSNHTSINNQLVTTMTTQDRYKHKLINFFVQYHSVKFGPDFVKIALKVASLPSTRHIDDNELRGLIVESFLSVWNLSIEELEMLRGNLPEMFLHCKATNPELFAQFESNTLNKVKFNSAGGKYDYPCVNLDVDGYKYMLVGGTSLHLHLFYGEVMFDRFGPYTGRIELTHGEFEAIRTRTLFFPQVYIK